MNLTTVVKFIFFFSFNNNWGPTWFAKDIFWNPAWSPKSVFQKPAAGAEEIRPGAKRILPDLAPKHGTFN